MAISVEKLLGDAKLLVTRLKDHDSSTEVLITHTQALNKRVEAMKQYQDDITVLNEIAKHRPRSTLVIGIAQENRQIRELQQENRDLRFALEEHQSALELIMQKYRQQISRLVHSNKMERLVSSASESNRDDVVGLLDRIQDMASVMQQAVRLDDQAAMAEQERLSRLQTENKALRELLEVCSTARQPILSAPVNEASDEKSNQKDSQKNSQKDSSTS